MVIFLKERVCIVDVEATFVAVAPDVNIGSPDCQ
jgi:hypothetical protein